MLNALTQCMLQSRACFGLWLLLPVVTLALSTAVAEDSKPGPLVYSQDFEVDLETLAHQHGWTLPGNQTQVKLHDDTVRGSSVLMIKRAGPDRQYARIRIPVTSGNLYTVEYQVRTVDVIPDQRLPRSRGAVLIAEFSDSEGRLVEGRTFSEGLFGTQDWQHRRVRLRRVVPPEACHLNLLLGLEGTGEAFFDDLRVYVHKGEFTQRHPVDGAVVDVRRPELRWEADFQRYRVELSTSPKFDKKTYLYAEGKSIRPRETLRPGTRYYWRILPWRPDRIGFTKSSPSPTLAFTVSEDASAWPPAVTPLGWKWRPGKRRSFDVIISPNRPKFSVRAWVEDIEAERVGVDGDRITFVPGEDLLPGLHDLRVEVRDSSGAQLQAERGFLNNAQPGAHSRIGEDGVMYINDEPFFPLGSFGDPSGDMTDFTGILEAKWNIVFNYHSAENLENAQRYLDDAHRRGLRVMLRHPGGWGYVSEGDEKRRRWVARFSQHPALAVWYLCDEPELYGFTTECVDRMIESVDQADPHTVTTMVSHYLSSFGRRGDVFMHMNYILGPYFKVSPGDPLDARRIYTCRQQGFQRARELWNLSEGEVRPQWAILQAFDPYQRQYAGDYKAGVEKVGPPDQPTYTETRCMAFSSLAYGAKGIFFWYFSPRSRYNIRTDAPAVWDGIVRTSHELRSLDAFLVQPATPQDDIALPEPLIAWTRQADNRRVLAVINPVAEPASATIDLSRYGVNAIQVRDSDHQSLPLVDGKVLVNLQPNEVKVFEWSPRVEPLR